MVTPTLPAGSRIFLDTNAIIYWAITDEVLERAAELRAATSIRTPDAILAATSLLAGCDFFITNDARLCTTPGLRTLLLSDTDIPLAIG